MSYRIKLNQLRAYQAIMLTGSVTAAAERLHTTQPAISRQLVSLEEAIAIRLFDRSSGGRMVPTTLGLRFFRHVEGTLSGIDDIPEVARDLATRGEARLRVGATPPLMNSTLLTGALQMLFERCPSIQLTLESRARQDIEEWVANGQIDVGLALLPADNPLVKTLPLIETAAVAVVHETHPLAKRKLLTPATIADTRLILPSRQLLRALIDRALAAGGVEMTADIEASSALNCCKLAADGLGLALCDPFSPTAFARAGLLVKRWQPNVPLTYGILVPERREMASGAREFIELLRLQARRRLMGQSGPHPKPARDVA